MRVKIQTSNPDHQMSDCKLRTCNPDFSLCVCVCVSEKQGEDIFKCLEG